MKILFFGDSITDASRDRQNERIYTSYGVGYVRHIAGKLLYENKDITILNRGVSGDRIVDLYARIKSDVWNETPDILSILIGVNDVWHEIAHSNGVDLMRFEKVYRMIIEDTLKVLPDVKIMLMQPFVLKGSATQDKWEQFQAVYEYADVVKKLADEYKLPFVELQKSFDEAAEGDVERFLVDGVHPNIAGATLIGNKWINTFEKTVKSI